MARGKGADTRPFAQWAGCVFRANYYRTWLGSGRKEHFIRRQLFSRENTFWHSFNKYSTPIAAAWRWCAKSRPMPLPKAVIGRRPRHRPIAMLGPGLTNRHPRESPPRPVPVRSIRPIGPLTTPTGAFWTAFASTTIGPALPFSLIGPSASVLRPSRRCAWRWKAIAAGRARSTPGAGARLGAVQRRQAQARALQADIPLADVERHDRYAGYDLAKSGYCPRISPYWHRRPLGHPRVGQI